MFDRLRAFLLSLMIIAVLVFSAVGTTVAYADGETPPETTETAPTEAPVDPDKPATVTVDTVDLSDSTDTAPTEVPVKETATPVPTVDLGTRGENTDAPVATEEVAPPADEAGSTHDTAPADGKPPVDTPILDKVPENTTVAVVNAEGELQPLATQAAADAIATSDPIWCPAGQAPTPGANGCTQSFTSFTALLTFLSGNASFGGAGTIYVQQGAYQGGESTINFDNYDLSNISSSDLTITGGWDTSTGTTNSTSTFNNVSIIIGSSNPWGGSLTLNNLVLTNPSGTGLTLSSDLDVTIDNVSVTNSTNGAGAEINAGRNVTITDSKFDRNKTAGSIIRAVGSVAISNSSFSTPTDARRQIEGLDIISGADVSLFQVLANGNRQAGATIDAAGRVTIVESQFNDTMSMNGSDFLGYGLTVVSQDAIDLDGVNADRNFLWGASLTAAGDVTIANSTFNANSTESPVFIDDTGLLVTSGGNVSIFNSHADDNRLIGATIVAGGDVTIGDSTFSNNNGSLVDTTGGTTFYGYGLQVVADGNISLSGVTASGNTLYGARLESIDTGDGIGDVTISNSHFDSQTSTSTTDLTGRGLEVITDGNVFLDNVTLNNNQTFGADIQAGGDVFLNAVTASGNGTDGVVVHTNCGNLFLIGGTYSNNGQYGVSVFNSALNQPVAPLFSGNGAGDIFQDPGTCVFTPTTPPTPPSNPPVYQPNDLGAVAPNIPGNALARSLQYGAGTINALMSGAKADTVGMTLNSYLAASGFAYGSTHVGPFIGKYAYLHLSSGLKIVVFAPSGTELALR